jgi:hypothetical protein
MKRESVFFTKSEFGEIRFWDGKRFSKLYYLQNLGQLVKVFQKLQIYCYFNNKIHIRIQDQRGEVQLRNSSHQISTSIKQKSHRNFTLSNLKSNNMKKLIYLFTLLISYTLSLHAQQVVWAKGMGGAEDDLGIGITIDKVGNVYTTGGFEDIADFDPGVNINHLTSNGRSDIFIQKLDDTGNFVWAKSMGGSSFDNGTSITVDTDGYVYITGEIRGRVDLDPNAGTNYQGNMGDVSAFIQKLDSMGNLVWAKSVAGSSSAQSASAQSECIKVDDAGNVYITGKFKGTVDFDPNMGVHNLSAVGSEDDIFVLKLDKDGNFAWAKTFGDTFYDVGFSLAVDSAENVFVTGTFVGNVDFDPGAGINILSGNGWGDIFILKLHKNGTFAWAKSMGSARNDYGTSIELDSYGNIYSTGFFEETVDFDPNSGVQNLISKGASDTYIQKLDSGGNLIWVKSIGSLYHELWSYLTVDMNGNVYITGNFDGTLDFDPGPGIKNITSTNFSDNYILKLDTHGKFAWAEKYEGNYARSIALDPQENVFVAAIFDEPINFNTTSGMVSLSPQGNRDVLILKISQNNNVAIEPSHISPFSIYPNPSSGSFFIDLPVGVYQAEVQVVDKLGRNVSQHIVTSPQHELDLSHISPGVYHLRMVFSTGAEYFQKIVRK